MNQSSIISSIEKRLKLEDYPQEIKEAIVFGLTENIFKRTLIVIAELLNEEEAKAFSQLTDAGDIENAVEYIREKHPEFDDLVTKTTQEVLDEFATHTA